MADEQDILINEKLNSLLAKQVEFEKTRARLSGESLSNLEQEQALLARREQYSREFSILLNEEDDRRKKTLELLKKDIDAELRKGEIVAEVAQQRKRALEDLNRAIEAGDKAEIERQKKKLKAIKEENKAREKTLDSMRSAGRAAEGLVDTMGNLAGISRDTGSTFRDIAKAIKGGKKSLAEFGTTAAKSLGDRFGLPSMLGMVLNNQLQMTVGFNQLQAQVLGATGANYELTQAIEDSSRSLKTQGVSFADAASSATALYRDFSRFSTVNTDLQKDIMATTSLLQNLGIDASTTARNFNFLVSEIGMSLPQANESIREMTETGASMGIAPQEMNQAFAALSPRLAEFGARAPNIFSSTAIMAKKLGINIEDMGGTLFALSDRLSTFEGSAMAVADIGTVLGGSFVNAFDLTMAAAEGPEAQLKLLRKAMRDSGTSFNQLGFFEQRFLANAFGLEVGKVRAILSDGADASKIFTGEQKTLEEMSKNATDSMKDQQLVFENLTKALNSSAKAMKDFSSAAVDMSKSSQDGGLGGLEMLLGASALISGGSVAFKGAAALKGMLGAGTAAATVGTATAKGGGIASMLFGKGGINLGLTAADTMGGLGKAATASKNIAPTAVAATAGKMGSKILPGIGAGLSLAMAGNYLMEGDFLGAGLEGISAALSFIPGIGTAGALGIQGFLGARAMGAFDPEAPAEAPTMALPPRTASPTRSITPAQIEQAMKNALASVKGSEQPIKVELYLDSSGRNKIAESTVRYIDRNYSTTGTARIPI